MPKGKETFGKLRGESEEGGLVVNGNIIRRIIKDGRLAVKENYKKGRVAILGTTNRVNGDQHTRLIINIADFGEGQDKGLDVIVLKKGILYFFGSDRVRVFVTLRDERKGSIVDGVDVIDNVQRGFEEKVKKEVSGLKRELFFCHTLYI